MHGNLPIKFLGGPMGLISSNMRLTWSLISYGTL